MTCWISYRSLCRRPACCSNQTKLTQQTLNQRSEYSHEFILNSTESFSRQTCGIDSENVAQDTAWAVQVFTATCRVIIRIDMDDTRMLHFQQDYLGCVGDEANILKKCDARRKVYSDNNFSSLSRWLGRLMSIPMTMTVAMYAISVPDVLVLENTLCCYDEQNKLDRYDEMFVRCCDVCCQCTSALGSAKSTLSCAYLLPSPPSLSSRGRGCKNL